MNPDQDPFSGLQIVNSDNRDLDFIFQLFKHAIEYQKRNGYELWPEFSRQLIQTEITEKRHWKILDGHSVVCVFSILFHDPVIWGEEKSEEPSIYLHRVAINPLFKGKGMMKFIKNWATAYGRLNGKKYVRMDTWGNNETLRKYYKDCGFNYLGQQHLAEIDGLPTHYGGSVLSLFQVEI